MCAELSTKFATLKGQRCISAMFFLVTPQFCQNGMDFKTKAVLKDMLKGEKKKIYMNVNATI